MDKSSTLLRHAFFLALGVAATWAGEQLTEIPFPTTEQIQTALAYTNLLMLVVGASGMTSAIVVSVVVSMVTDQTIPHLPFPDLIQEYPEPPLPPAAVPRLPEPWQPSGPSTGG